MNMKNLLQALNDIEPPKVEDKKMLIQEGANPGQILNVQMEDLDSASLRYLSGVRKTIEECGMAPMSPPAPRPPATINITAADSHELGSLLKTMANLADHGHDKMNEPVYRADPSPAYHDSNLDMKGMVKLIDDGEIEEEIIQDGMNDDVPVYDNSPDRQTKEGDWPLNGDMDNNKAANGNVIVDRNKMDIAEQLMAEYKKFVAETAKISQALIDQDRLAKINQAEANIKQLEIDLGNAKQIQETLRNNGQDTREIDNKVASLERELSVARADVPHTGPHRQTVPQTPPGLGPIAEAWDVKTKVSPKEKGKYKGKTAAQLRKQLNSLKKSGPHKKGSKEYGEMRELQFAIRAKTGWGKVSNSKKK